MMQWGETQHLARLVTSKDIEKEYQLAMAKLSLMEKYSDFGLTFALPDAGDAVAFYIKEGNFQAAVITSTMFEIDMTPIFTALALLCIEGNPVDEFSHTPPASRNWLYLCHLLEQYDSKAQGYPLTKIVIRTLLGRSPTLNLPQWLTLGLQVCFG